MFSGFWVFGALRLEMRSLDLGVLGDFGKFEAISGMLTESRDLGGSSGVM